MELLNATKMQAGYTMGVAPDGRESLVVVVKGTFHIPDKPSQEAELAEEQMPLVLADTFEGEPGFSAPVYESEFPPKKPKCDVLLNGSAYAPGGQPTKRVNVSLQVGDWRKTFTVIGNRTWKRGWFGVSATKPESFTIMPISYGKAFGGTDTTHEDPKKHRFVLTNPVGRGFHHHISGKLINGKPLPNTEEEGRSVKNPHGEYRPMAFGPIGRNWDPRYKLAGTYDQNWIDNIFPFLPLDFNDAYYQAAPVDQQIPYLRGGETVTLTNLTPEGTTRFTIPTIEMPIVFFPKKGDKQEAKGAIDTIIIEPDQQRFMLLWRQSYRLKRNMFDVVQVVAGVMPKAWYRARELGKTYYPSLGALVSAKMRERAETEA
ncbi:DUF2169 family type VI secretion system accessory protein [Nitrospira sp. BLG_2]|uniref:DUF2169 family type VI secretion system accessory protein n=1 Tax=Nitrospira sp. BLG_2 TaxID=3397507 RepID=UPI003B9A42FE